MADNAPATPAEAAPAAEESFWKRIFTRTLPSESRALFGTLAFLVTLVAGIYIGVNEQRRMETYDAQYNARSIQRGAGLFFDNCRPCHGPNGEGIAGVAPALNNPDLFNGNRVSEVGFAGSVEDFVQLTIAAGRPVRTGDWPQPMPTWSQAYGGPLRQDQVRDLTRFVMNWGCAYDEEAECYDPDFSTAGLPTPAPTQEAVEFEPVCAAEGQDCTPVAELPAGDAARGEALFMGTEPAPDGSTLGCSGCHTLDGSVVVGPSMQGISERVPDGYDSLEAFIHESITNPGAYLREGFADAMPKTFGVRLDDQSLADLIAFVSGQ